MRRLLDNGRGSVDQLSSTLATSPASIRRDLIRLEFQALVTHTHGGAVLSSGTAVYGPFRFDASFQERADRFAAEKQRIARAAAALPGTDCAQNFADVKLSSQQVAWLDLEFGVIIHFSTDTFLNQEWGDGTASPSVFNPTSFHPAQWMRSIRERGARSSWVSLLTTADCCRRARRTWRISFIFSLHFSDRGCHALGVPACVQRSTLQAESLLKEPEDARNYIAELCRRSPEIAACADLAREFVLMIRERDATAWPNWKNNAKSSLLASFAKHLSHDEDALLAALQQPWSNGPVEGHVHRLKLIKSSMYGRAKFDLLRLRVVNAD